MKQNNDQIDSYLSFTLGKETFASNVSKVLNILEVMDITEVPQSPDYMRGVFNLRGEVLPVVDLRFKFGMAPTEITTDTCLLVLDVNVNEEPVKIGALVDSVKEVLTLNEEDIQDSFGIGNKYKSDFINGMAKTKEGLIMILDMDMVFSGDEILEITENVSMDIET